MSFGMWTRMDPKEARISLDGGKHWRNMANTIEPSVCGGDAALCHIIVVKFEDIKLKKSSKKFKM